MVRTSNWPPLVAMSVVTFWRSAFSSSVTHSTVIPGLFAVKWSVRPCMRIMSPLLTVAMVSLVSAAAAPTKLAMTPAVNSIWNAVFIDFLPWCRYVSFCPTCEHLLKSRPDESRRYRRCSAALGVASEGSQPPDARELASQQALGHRLIGDEAADQLAGECRSKGLGLGRTHRRGDDKPLGRAVEANAGDAIAGQALDQPALAVV